MYNNIYDGSNITVGNLDLMVKIHNINGVNYYSLYNKDGTIYASYLNSLDSLEISKIDGVNVSNYSNQVESTSSYNSNTSDNTGYSSSNSSSYYRSTSNANIGSTKRSAAKENLSESETKVLSNSLGSIESTQDVVRYCTAILEDSKIAQNGIVNTRDAIDNASLKGYGTEASVSYFNLLTSAIDIAKNNTEITKEASKSLNNLNIYIKDLLSKYVEKKKCELELAALNSRKPTYRSWSDEDGNTYDNQDEINAWQAEYDRVAKQISDLNTEIDDLKNKSDDLYRDISSKYGNLLNLDIDGVKVNSNETSNTTKSVIDVTNGTFSQSTFVASNGTEVDYYIYVPTTSETNLPVHLYMPGSGESEEKMLSRSLPKELKSGNLNIGGIVVMPQVSIVGYNDNGYAIYNYDASNGKSTGYHDALIELLDDVVEQYDADKNRISVSGVSRGAENAYVLVGNNPGYFSSYVAVSGSPEWISRNSSQWESISNTNLLVVHGSSDTSLPIEKHGVQKVNNTLKDLGLSNSNVSYVTIGGGTHGIDREIFNEEVNINGENKNIIEWAMSQTKI